MRSDRSLSPSSPPEAVPLAGLVRTHWVFAICPGCGHEQVRGERQHASCPGCGAPLRSFAMYRDLQAQR